MTRLRRIRLPLGLLALSLAAQEFHVEKIEAGFRYADGIAWSYEGFLVFSDAPNNRIFRLIPGRPLEVSREDSGGAAGNAFDAQGRLYTCETRGRRVVRFGRKGEVEVLAERFEGKRLNAPNGIAVRRDGHVYFTDPAFGSQADARELNFYGVYHLTPKRELSIVARPAGRPNGIALSPNGRVLYVANSDEHNVRAYDLDGKGTASGERVLVSDIEGVPAGLCTDPRGNVWVAARAVLAYTPQGRRLHRVEINETPSDCASGDAGFLYVTARGSIYRVRLP